MQQHDRPIPNQVLAKLRNRPPRALCPVDKEPSVGEQVRAAGVKVPRVLNRPENVPEEKVAACAKRDCVRNRRLENMDPRLDDCQELGHCGCCRRRARQQRYEGFDCGDWHGQVRVRVQCVGIVRQNVKGPRGGLD